MFSVWVTTRLIRLGTTRCRGIPAPVALPPWRPGPLRGDRETSSPGKPEVPTGGARVGRYGRADDPIGGRPRVRLGARLRGPPGLRGPSALGGAGDLWRADPGAGYRRDHLATGL